MRKGFLEDDLVVWIIKIPLEIRLIWKMWRKRKRRKKTNLFGWWFVIKKLVIGYYAESWGKEMENISKQASVQWCYKIKRIYFATNCLCTIPKKRSHILFARWNLCVLVKMEMRLSRWGEQTHNIFNKIIAFIFSSVLFFLFKLRKEEQKNNKKMTWNCFGFYRSDIRRNMMLKSWIRLCLSIIADILFAKTWKGKSCV